MTCENTLVFWDKIAKGKNANDRFDGIQYRKNLDHENAENTVIFNINSFIIKIIENKLFVLFTANLFILGRHVTYCMVRKPLINIRTNMWLHNVWMIDVLYRNGNLMNSEYFV